MRIVLPVRSLISIFSFVFGTLRMFYSEFPDFYQQQRCSLTSMRFRSLESLMLFVVMSLSANLEDCIWGRYDWDEYTRELITCERINEGALLEKIEVVKGNIGRQIRKAVEQHHPRLLEQASALQNLNRVQAIISREMEHLFVASEQLSSRFQNEYEQLRSRTLRLEQLFALRRILSAACRCKHLIQRFNATSELVKRSEIVCELKALAEETSCLKNLNTTREVILVTIPKLVTETRQTTAEQLRASLDSLNAPLVSSCLLALQNLSSYESEIKNLIDERSKQLDAQFLQLNSSEESAGKLLPHLATKIQMLLEQFTLLGREVVSQFCEQLSKIIARRVPENAPYAARFVQLLSKPLSVHPAEIVALLEQSLRPLRRAILSQSLSRLFRMVDSTLVDSNFGVGFVDRIIAPLKDELSDVEWDVQLRSGVESNIAKVLNLIAQKIEQRLVLEESALQMGERLSTIQRQNYDMITAARALSEAWPGMGNPLAQISVHAQDAIIAIAQSSVMTILNSMHTEELNDPSPYVKELCCYLRVFQNHASSFLLPSCTQPVAVFLDYVLETFLLHSSLLRPLDSIKLKCLSSDLEYIARVGLTPFKLTTSSLSMIPEYMKAFTLSPKGLANDEKLPFWFVVQLLISQSDSALLSPHMSTGWTVPGYIKWFQEHNTADRLSFLSSLLQTYTSSVISRGCAEYDANYPYIMDVLQRSSKL